MHYLTVFPEGITFVKRFHNIYSYNELMNLFSTALLLDIIQSDTDNLKIQKEFQKARKFMGVC